MDTRRRELTGRGAIPRFKCSGEPDSSHHTECTGYALEFGGRCKASTEKPYEHVMLSVHTTISYRATAIARERMGAFALGTEHPPRRKTQRHARGHEEPSRSLQLYVHGERGQELFCQVLRP